MFTLPQVSPEARAAARLASGQPLWLSHGGHHYWIVAAEGAQPNSLPGAGGQLFITSQRAAALGAKVETSLAALKLPPRADTLESIINPLKLSQSEWLQDFSVKPVPADHPANLALDLIKQSGSLPALIMGPQVGKPPSDAMIYEAPAQAEITVLVTRTSEADLPLKAAPQTRVIAFRDQDGATHLALMVKNPEQQEAPTVRVHSSCLTGDILGSLRCDCGDQLQAALRHMHENQGGIVLYLDQEGRNIGLANKLRAYQLQDAGLDTYTANHALGFEDDERSFEIAAAMLADLGVGRIRLLSNNPGKQARLVEAGIEVEERLPLIAAANPHNAHYLATKADKGGHMLQGRPKIIEK
jgi:GTP cyclohydrolase II